jgi:hypothetical protein
MSNNEKNLTTGEREVLKNLNTRAHLILKAEGYLQEAKIPFNSEIFYEMDEKSLVDFIENWDPVNMEIQRQKFISKK